MLSRRKWLPFRQWRISVLNLPLPPLCLPPGGTSNSQEATGNHRSFPSALSLNLVQSAHMGHPPHAAVPEPQPQLQPSPSPWGLSSPGERWQWMTSGQAYRPCGQCLSPDTRGYRPSPLSPQYYVGDVRERRPDCYTSIIRGRCAVHGGR